MRFNRRRPGTAGQLLGSSLETLESRTLLSKAPNLFAPWEPGGLPVNALAKQADTNPNAQFINNKGKLVTGMDRNGDTYTIRVFGPGLVQVTDITPYDGVLDDPISTIQLIGTTNKTRIVGQATTGFNSPQETGGVVGFNQLVSNTPVKSIVLNGFTLTAQQQISSNGTTTSRNTGIYLAKGVGLLQFHDILAPIDQSTNAQPINVVIGDPSTPLKVQPTIRLDEIFNTVFSSTAASVSTSPQTTPTVSILVNGTIRSLDFISSTQHPTVDPAQEARQTIDGIDVSTPGVVNPTKSPIDGAGKEINFPIVGTTGRTAIRANAIHTLYVHGSAINVTASKGAVPFQNAASGLTRLGRAKFGGNADALGLDVRGKIGGLAFQRGLGNPTGTAPASTLSGVPVNKNGYPANAKIGGLVTAKSIGHVNVGPADVNTQHSTNPQFVQLYHKGSVTYFVRPGNALTSAAIVTSGSIHQVHVIGNLSKSEIKTGFDYPSYAAGLEGTRATSHIARIRVRGDLAGGVVSSTYRPIDHAYGNANSAKDNGLIQGSLHGTVYVTNGTAGPTPLGNFGSGVFARHKKGHLPPGK